jgi:hypothetical protein
MGFLLDLLNKEKKGMIFYLCFALICLFCTIFVTLGGFDPGPLEQEKNNKDTFGLCFTRITLVITLFLTLGVLFWTYGTRRMGMKGLASVLRESRLL